MPLFGGGSGGSDAGGSTSRTARLKRRAAALKERARDRIRRSNPPDDRPDEDLREAAAPRGPEPKRSKRPEEDVRESDQSPDPEEFDPDDPPEDPRQTGRVERAKQAVGKRLARRRSKKRAKAMRRERRRQRLKRKIAPEGSKRAAAIRASRDLAKKAGSGAAAAATSAAETVEAPERQGEPMVRAPERDVAGEPTRPRRAEPVDRDPATQEADAAGGESFTVDAPEAPPGSLNVSENAIAGRPVDRPAPGERTRATRTDLNVDESLSAPGQGLRRSLLDTGEYVRENPGQAGATIGTATAASPVVGDEAIGLPAAAVLGGIAVVSQATRRPGRTTEIPVPESGEVLGGSELTPSENPRLGESEITPTRATDVPDAEIDISREDVRQINEIPVGEGTREQAEIPIGDTGQEPETTGKAGETVVPDEFPTAGRDFPADPTREYVPQADVGAAVSDTPAEQMGEDLITPTGPTIDEDTGSGVGEQTREFPTGEDSVVGRETTTEEVAEPEITVEDVTNELGFPSETAPGVGGVPGVPPAPGISEVPEPAVEVNVTPEVGVGTGTGTGTDTVPETVVDTVPETVTDTATEAGQGFGQGYGYGFETAPGYSFEAVPGYGYGGGGSGDPTRGDLPAFDFDPDPRDDRRPFVGGLADFRNPIATAPEAFDAEVSGLGIDAAAPDDLGIGEYDPVPDALDGGDGGIF